MAKKEVSTVQSEQSVAAEVVSEEAVQPVAEEVVSEQPAPVATLVKARVLSDCGALHCNDIVESTPEYVASLVAAGLADASPEAVEYAEAQGAAVVSI